METGNGAIKNDKISSTLALPLISGWFISIIINTITSVFYVSENSFPVYYTFWTIMTPVAESINFTFLPDVNVENTYADFRGAVCTLPRILFVKTSPNELEAASIPCTSSLESHSSLTQRNILCTISTESRQVGMMSWNGTKQNSDLTTDENSLQELPFLSFQNYWKISFIVPNSLALARHTTKRVFFMVASMLSLLFTVMSSILPFPQWLYSALATSGWEIG